eukprot:3256854-Rhodomonas_salina.2
MRACECSCWGEVTPRAVIGIKLRGEAEQTDQEAREAAHEELSHVEALRSLRQYRASHSTRVGR